MQELNYIKINFSPDQVKILNFCLAFIMYGVSLEINRTPLKEFSSNIKSVVLGLCSQFLMLPILTGLLVWLLKPEPSIAAGMILIAACPGGNVSNYATNLAKGNVTLSVILTIISSLFSVISTPLILKFLSSLLLNNTTHVYVSFKDMFLTTAQIIFIPLLLGFWTQVQFPEFVKKSLRYFKKISILIFLSFIIFAILGNLDNLKSYIHLVFFYVVIHNLCSLALGYTFPRIFRVAEDDCRAISIETGIQNSGLGLVLVFNFFNGNGGMALIAAWWSIWHLISAGLLAKFWQTK